MVKYTIKTLKLPQQKEKQWYYQNRGAGMYKTLKNPDGFTSLELVIVIMCVLILAGLLLIFRGQ